MPESTVELDLLLLTVAAPREGAARWHPPVRAALLLNHTAAFVGEPVTIRYDPRGLAEIRVYHHNVFVCRALAPEIAATSI